MTTCATWTKLPEPCHDLGLVYYWRRVVLSDGTIYSALIHALRWWNGRAYYTNQHLTPMFDMPITEDAMVTWAGPITYPRPDDEI